MTVQTIPDEVARIWLAGQLGHASITAAGSTGVYDHPGPNEAVEPFVSVQYLSERPLSPIGKGAAELYRIEELVRVWDEGSSAKRADAIAGAVHARLQRQGPDNVAGGQVFACYRVAGVPFDSILEAGKVFRISGGIYALFVRVD